MTPTLSIPTFSELARKALTMAQEEQTWLRHWYIGTEHLLLGVLRCRGPVADLLANAGIIVDVVRDELKMIRPGTGSEGGEVSLSPRARAAVERAVNTAQNDGAGFVDPVHLMLGILEVSDSIAVGILHRHQVDLDRLTEQLHRLSSTA